MPLEIKRRGAVGVLTLSRPAARNAWDEDYNRELIRVLGEWEDDDGVRAVVLTGDESGGAFSTGANLAPTDAHSTGGPADFIRTLPKARRFAANVISDFPKPVVAAVNGYAIGIGCIVTFACDLIVASDRAEWRMPQVALGILPAHAGAVRLARWVGKGQAMKMALGFPLAADEAHRIGLAQWLVPHAELMARTMGVAEHLAGLPPLAARLVKESMNNGQDIPNVRDAALADMYRFYVLELTEDKVEGHSAWRERREPSFRGR
jgi:enoyl-CoA hydratase/carnithine racemase